MHALVTGGAGFIGSHLTERLLGEGATVRVVDCLTEYYDPALKASTLDALATAGAEVHRVDLGTAELGPLLDGVDVVFHQAGQPGVRLSWAEGFPTYVERNIALTQRLLEAVRDQPLRRFVYASSSSVYGDAESFPTPETALPRPVSPYGVTKLAAEHLCGLYASNWGVPTLSLRYFTVYGPRQRPDMAFHRLIEAALSGSAFPLYGDGSQIRDFTYVADAVDANLAAATAELDTAPPGTVVNVSGGGSVSLAETITVVEELTGHTVTLDRKPAAAGDAVRTGGDHTLATELLGWAPRTPLRDGLAAQVGWHRARRS